MNCFANVKRYGADVKVLIVLAEDFDDYDYLETYIKTYISSRIFVFNSGLNSYEKECEVRNVLCRMFEGRLKIVDYNEIVRWGYGYSFLYFINENNHDIEQELLVLKGKINNLGLKERITLCKKKTVEELKEIECERQIEDLKNNVKGIMYMIAVIASIVSFCILMYSDIGEAIMLVIVLVALCGFIGLVLWGAYELVVYKCNDKSIWIRITKTLILTVIFFVLLWCVMEGIKNWGDVYINDGHRPDKF